MSYTVTKIQKSFLALGLYYVVARQKSECSKTDSIGTLVIWEN